MAAFSRVFEGARREAARKILDALKKGERAYAEFGSKRKNSMFQMGMDIRGGSVHWTECVLTQRGISPPMNVETLAFLEMMAKPGGSTFESKLKEVFVDLLETGVTKGEIVQLLNEAVVESVMLK